MDLTCPLTSNDGEDLSEEGWAIKMDHFAGLLGRACAIRPRPLLVPCRPGTPTYKF
jgi:hypothetical protein